MIFKKGTPPPPHPRYAGTAARARSHGAHVKDTDFEVIDAFRDAIREWEGEQNAFSLSDAGFLQACGIANCDD